MVKKGPIGARVSRKGVPMSKQDPRSKAAKALADVTGKEEADFEPDFETYPLPDPEELERVSADEFYADE